jgi:hypothetical protein
MNYQELVERARARLASVNGKTVSPKLSGRLSQLRTSELTTEHGIDTTHTTSTVNMASGDTHYHPKDAIRAGVNGAMITGTAGLAVSAIQNTLQKRNVGAWGVFTRTGTTVAIFSTGSTFRRYHIYRH